MDALGDSGIVWEYQGLSGRQFDANGTALGPVTTVVPGPSRQFQPAVAADAAGNSVVAYFSFGDLFVHARRFNAAGVQQGADIVVGPPGSYDYITWPSVVQTPGGFAVFWDQDDAFIHGQQYDTSGNLVDSINVPEPTHVIRPRVGADAAGNFVVVYGIQYADYLGGPLYGQRISAAGAAVGSSFSLTVTTGAASADPVVAVEGNGTFAASWLNYTGAASLAGLGYLDAAYGFTYVTAYSFVGGNDIAYMYNNPTYVYVAGFPVVVYRAR